ncbi:MAG TPA: hypothetical protein VGJ02_01560, partial [Pyrinomonadaceae bacterium]
MNDSYNVLIRVLGFYPRPEVPALILPIILALAFSVAAQTPAAIEHELLGYLDAASKAGSYSDGYDEAKNTKANDAIRQTLERAGKKLDVLR